MEAETSDESAACRGKQPHDRHNANRIARKYPEADIYKCKYCGHWHLGHRKSNGRKSRKTKFKVSH